MSFWKEIKWTIAIMLVNWSFDLVHKEATIKLLECYIDILQNFDNDPRYNTVKIRS